MPTKVKKVTWTDEEDRVLLDLIEKFQKSQWSKIADELFRICRCRRKTGRQCRQRWYNQLNPKIVRKQWSMVEQDILFEEHQKHGSKWSKISEKLEGRTENNIKNHFYSTIRKILRRIIKYMGSKNGTVEIKKIKPTALSKIFFLTEGGMSLKMEENSFGGGKAYADQERKKQIIYKIINQSRQKISENILEVNQQESQLLEKLLQQVQKTNQLHQKERTFEIMVKKEKNLEKNFDYYAASSQSSSNSHHFQKINKKTRKRDQKRKENTNMMEQIDAESSQNQQDNFEIEINNFHHVKKGCEVRFNFERLNEIESQNISKCHRQMIIFQRQSSHLSRLEQLIIQGATDNSNSSDMMMEGFDFNIQIGEDHIIDENNIQKCIRMSPASPAFDYFRIKRFQKLNDGEDNNENKLSQFNKVIQQKDEQQQQFLLGNQLL